MQLQKYIRTLSRRFSKVFIQFLSSFCSGLVEFLGVFRDLLKSFLERFPLVFGQFWQEKVYHKVKRRFEDVQVKFYDNLHPGTSVHPGSFISKSSHWF